MDKDQVAKLQKMLEEINTKIELSNSEEPAEWKISTKVWEETSAGYKTPDWGQIGIKYPDKEENTDEYEQDKKEWIPLLPKDDGSGNTSRKIQLDLREEELKKLAAVIDKTKKELEKREKAIAKREKEIAELQEFLKQKADMLKQLEAITDTIDKETDNES